jgi:hypothetical protein
MNLSAAYLQKQQEWKEEGRQQGRTEQQQEVTIAMLKENLSPNLIVKTTGLPINH